MMMLTFDPRSLVHAGHEHAPWRELAAASVAALADVAPGQAARIQDALDAASIGALAESRYVLAAQAIATLARYETSDAANPALFGLIDNRYQTRRARDLVTMSPAILTGLSDKEAALLRDTLGIRTIGDLAQHRVIVAAQIVARLAAFENAARDRKAA